MAWSIMTVLRALAVCTGMGPLMLVVNVYVGRLPPRRIYKVRSSRLVDASGGLRTGAYLSQWIALAVQRDNVVSVMGTLSQIKPGVLITNFIYFPLVKFYFTSTI